MDNSTDRAKILIEELKILQGVINRMVQNSLECKKWTLALVVGVLSLKKVIQGAIPMADRKQA